MKRTQLLLFGAWMSALVFAGCADGPSCPPGTRKIGTRCIRLATDDAGLDASVSNVGASDQDASSAEAGAPDRGVVCSEGEPKTLYRDADGDGFGSVTVQPPALFFCARRGSTRGSDRDLSIL